MLFVHCKDTNLKAIHNVLICISFLCVLFVHCKDTNLKAIHNYRNEQVDPLIVVRALQRY